MEARRLLKAGQPLQAADLKAAAVIRKGDPVTLIYATAGVKLTVDGVAQNEAAQGRGRARAEQLFEADDRSRGARARPGARQLR